jgi:hypothetical protein
VLIINVVAMEMLRSKLPPLHVLDNRYKAAATVINNLPPENMNKTAATP